MREPIAAPRALPMASLDQARHFRCLAPLLGKDGAMLGCVLLTNDDGIDAPGLQLLERVAATLAREVWVVAPEHDQSGTSHALSLHAPLRVSPRGERRFAVRGTPGDCVVVGMRHLLGAMPDLVLSGINRGSNIGMETVLSGTIGAAMTAMFLGARAIALSQAFEDGNVPWETAEALAAGVIRQLADLQWDGACLSVNFPPCTPDRARGLAVTRQGVGLLDTIDVVERTDPRGIMYQWLHMRRGARQDTPGTEAAAIAAGHVSVTPLRFERTDEAAFASLAARLPS
jgi:5'-nucleotidase